MALDTAIPVAPRGVLANFLRVEIYLIGLRIAAVFDVAFSGRFLELDGLGYTLMRC